MDIHIDIHINEEKELSFAPVNGWAWLNVNAVYGNFLGKPCHETI